LGLGEEYCLVGTTWIYAQCGQIATSSHKCGTGCQLNEDPAVLLPRQRLDVWIWQILLQKSFCAADQNSFGRRRDFRVKMWGTSSPEDKLAGDLGNVIEATSVVGRIFLQKENWRRAI
jgi:hypothetical protein